MPGLAELAIEAGFEAIHGPAAPLERERTLAVFGTAIKSNLTNVLDKGVRRAPIRMYDSTGGDSGGPVWYYVFLPGGTTAVIAMGTHVHSDDDDDETPYGWYSPIDVGAAQYLANWAYSYTLCVTASC